MLVFVLQLLELREQFSVFLPEVLDLALVDLHGGLEGIHLFVHDTVKQLNVLVVVDKLAGGMHPLKILSREFRVGVGAIS